MFLLKGWSVGHAQGAGCWSVKQASSFWTVLFSRLLEQQVKSRGKYEAPLGKNLGRSYIYSIKLPILRSLFWKAKWFAQLIIFVLAFVVSFCQEVCHPTRPG